MLNPNTTRFLCDKCQGEFLYRDLEVVSGNTKFCKECYANRDEALTAIQRSLLIWLYNHQQWQHIDQGNLMEAYVEITENENFEIKTFLMDIQALVMAKYVRTHTLDCFYQITPEGKKYLENSIDDTIIFQCDQCGDFWSLDHTDDPMILSAYLEEHPSGTTIEQTCSACENENLRESEFYGDPDNEYDTWDDVLVYGE